MVEHSSLSLDRVFGALADPTRRGMLSRLAAGEASIGELASPFSMSFAAASKHVRVLESAGLIRRRVEGRSHLCRIEGGPLAEATRWLAFHERYWSERFDALDAALAAPPSPARRREMSHETLKLRITRHFWAPPSVVFGAWTDPESPVGWWGPKGFSLAFYESDLHPGGHWRIGMRSAEGELMVSAGTYHEIVPPTRLVMTHGWEDADRRLGPETLVTITLTARDGGTDMAFEQTGFETTGNRDGHGAGWGEAFDALADAVAGVAKPA